MGKSRAKKQAPARMAGSPLRRNAASFAMFRDDPSFIDRQALIGRRVDPPTWIGQSGNRVSCGVKANRSA